jgi:hypothetical protein
VTLDAGGRMFTQSLLIGCLRWHREHSESGRGLIFVKPEKNLVRLAARYIPGSMLLCEGQKKKTPRRGRIAVSGVEALLPAKRSNG